MKYSKQEIFNRVWEHYLVNGGGAGWNADKNRCVYHTKEGNSCAIGVFDEGKKLSGVDMSVSRLRLSLLELLFGEMICGDVDFLTSIQHAHDTAARHANLNGEPKGFASRLQDNMLAVATQYNLTTPESIRNA